MGTTFSITSRTKRSEHHDVLQSESCKRQRLSSSLCEDHQRLIPNLPDEISMQILARLPRISYLKVKSVSRAWKKATTSFELFTFRKLLGKTEEWLYLLTKVGNHNLSWYALDPSSMKWQRLPIMPVFPEDECNGGLASFWWSNIKISDVIRGWLGRKDVLDHNPFSGCAVGAVDGSLYVIGRFSGTSASKRVIRYNPVLNKWSEVCSMINGRAYCKTGVINNKLYVVGGVTKTQRGLTPLQSGEVFDPSTGMWSEIPDMPFSKTHVLPTAFLTDLLKPMATGMTPYSGKIMVPQSLYCWPFFVDVGGEVYDPETNSWVEMAAGMGEGWPARQAGTKMSVSVNGYLYALDPSSSLDSGAVKVYDDREDAWKVVVDVPIHGFTESESPFLLAGFLGKLHVITKDASNCDILVIQVDMQNHSDSLTLSSNSSPGNALVEPAESVAESDAGVWKVIATRCASSAELVSCQTLAI